MGSQDSSTNGFVFKAHTLDTQNNSTKLSAQKCFVCGVPGSACVCICVRACLRVCQLLAGMTHLICSKQICMGAAVCFKSAKPTIQFSSHAFPRSQVKTYNSSTKPSVCVKYITSDG